MRLEISRRALLDLELIHHTGVTHFGIAAAAKYSRGLLNLFELILSNPLMARERPEYRNAERLLRYKSHVVFYRVEGGTIKIVRVLHGRQDWREYL